MAKISSAIETMADRINNLSSQPPVQVMSLPAPPIHTQLQKKESLREVTKLSSQISNQYYYQGMLRDEMHGLKRKKGCSTGSHNLTFFRGQLNEKEKQLGQQRFEISKLTRENEMQDRRIEDLLNDNADLRMRLRETEPRGIAVPWARDRSRDAETWSPHSQTRNQSWMTADEKRRGLLKPFLHK